MNQNQKRALFGLRLVLGWMYLYAGLTKLVNPEWSAAGYLKAARGFAPFYHAMLDPTILPLVNFMNEWGLTLLGISLLVGAYLRYSAYAGMLLMALYYGAILQFPYPNEHAFLVDEHVIYIAALAVLVLFDAGHVWGFDGWWEQRKNMTKKA